MIFRFRLERILLHRKRKVDACARAVAMAQARLEATERYAAALADDLVQSRRQAAEERLARLDATAMERQLAWHEALQLRSQEAEAKVQQAWVELQSARQQLRQAWQDREVLQQLKERKHEDWARSVTRREQRDLDEVGLIQAVLSSSGGSDGQRSMSPAAGSSDVESDGP